MILTWAEGNSPLMVLSYFSPGFHSICLKASSVSPCSCRHLGKQKIDGNYLNSPLFLTLAFIHPNTLHSFQYELDFPSLLLGEHMPSTGLPPHPRDITLSISLAPVASASSFLLLLPSVLKHDHISPVLKKINPPSLPSPSCFFLDPVLSHSSQFSIYISSNPVLPVHTITLHNLIPFLPHQKTPLFQITIVLCWWII